MKRFDDTRPEFSPYGFTCEVWIPSRMPRPDRHNEVELNLLTGGSLTYLLGGRHVTIEAGRLATFWAAIPHQIVDTEGESPYYVITLPLGDFLTAGLPLATVNRILQGEVMVDSTTDPCDEMKFRQWERESRANDPVGHLAARLEIRARLLRQAGSFSSKKAIQYQDPALSRADHLACYIARNYHKSLTASSIAAAAGLNPNYAMNLFRRAFGTTMSSFITQHRITHAQRLLLTTDASVLDVALESGFQSLSRFNEAFKDACGCPPREYRKAHRGIAPL